MVSTVSWYMKGMKLSFLIQTTKDLINQYERYLSCKSDTTVSYLGLRVSKEKGVYRFYAKPIALNSQEKYLPSSELDTAKAIAQQEYERKVRMEASKTLSVLKRTLERLDSCKEPDEIYDCLSDVRKSLVVRSTPAIVDAAKWKDRGYYRKHAFSIHDRVIVARNGLRVRSKTEEIIVNIFEELEIPYIYEYPIVIDGEWVYPDFTVLNTRTGKEYIYEHCGKMDDPDYVERNLLRKLELYAKKGIFEGDNLLLTFETNSHPLNEQYLLSFIRKHFL